jgi:hypothetical protein
MQAHQLFLRLFCQSYGTIGGMIKIACEYALPVLEINSQRID